MTDSVRGTVAVNLSKVTNQDEVARNLESQLSEVEMLEAMFANPGEFVMDEPETLDDCRRWLVAASSNRVDFVPPTINFRIQLSVGEKGDPVQMFVTFPHEYPSEEKPEFYVRSESLNRNIHGALNKDLNTFITENVDIGEVSAFQVISWLQDNVDSYVERSAQEQKSVDTSGVKKLKASDSSPFTRFWIYSHHIYSKIKRRDILDLSKEFQLTGFSMPGKPGIICMEGSERNVNEAWAIVKSWNWKKINVRLQETDDSRGDIDDARRFSSFEEIGFVKPGETRDYHMDMGEFHKYLDQHDCGYMFKELFGV